MLDRIDMELYLASPCLLQQKATLVDRSAFKRLVSFHGVEQNNCYKSSPLSPQEAHVVA